MPNQSLSLYDPLIEVTQEGDHIKAYSRLYDDIYFSSQNGYEESMAVFITPTGLTERLGHVGLTTIAELGFGTGLNFCIVLELFRRLAPADKRLHYIATEHAPLHSNNIREVLSAYPQLQKECDDLIAVLPPRWPGRHRVFLDKGRVTLDLAYQDSKAMLAVSDFNADIWFLDGFTPARNPNMWQDDIFQHMARCSSNGAVCASFSAAGAVRRGLEKAGFDVTKHDGFGHKRHRITGVLSASITGRSKSAIPSRIKIIGAGIAGASLAHALARRQIDVEVLDAAPAAAHGASGNIAALQSPRLTVDVTDHGWLSLNAFGFARRSALAMGAGLDEGLITLAKDNKEALRQQKLLSQEWPETLFSPMDPAVVSSHLGFKLSTPGLYYPYGGAIDPRQWINGLLASVSHRYGVNIVKMETSSSAIILTDQNGVDIEADAVVIAAGTGLSALWAGRLEPILPITANLGQVTHIPPLPDNHLRTPVSFGGYLARASNGYYALGASYQRIDVADTISKVNEIGLEAHDENYYRLPKVFQNQLPYDPENWLGRQSIRATTPDRQPIAGKVGNGIYILGGLGSRGMVTAPLLAEAIAADICEEPSPLDQVMRRAIDPFRFSRRAGL